MKNVIYSVFTMLLLVTTSCNKDDDSVNTDAQLIMEVSAHAVEGLWQVTSYIDSGENETNDYNGYSFDFAESGVLTATKGADVVIGSWSVTSSDDDSSDDDGNDTDDIDFNIFFNVNESSVFDDLSDDWDITSASATQISLFDVSGGDGSTDILVFGRI